MSDDERPDLNALLEHYGSNTKQRTSYNTSCPLHEDKTPSLSVNTDRGLWNCKSCGKGGDAYTLIELMEETDFGGARKFAAALGLATGSSGGGGEDVRGGSYSGRRKRALRKGDRRGGSSYVPRWRRNG